MDNPHSPGPVNEEVLNQLVLRPLAELVGLPLREVAYFVAEVDLEDFELESPNKSGPIAISLQFGERVIYWTYYSKRNLADGFCAYHLFPYHNLGELFNDGADVHRFSAAGTAVWRDAMSTNLKSVQVYGSGRTALAIRLAFAATEVVIALGKAGAPPTVNDGDEMIILSVDDFEGLAGTSYLEYHLIWEYPGAVVARTS